MFSTENGNTGMVMPVSPMYSGGYGGGFGGFGNDWIILFLLASMWGFGGFGGMGGFGGGLGIDFPWLMNGQSGINANTNAGFNQAATAGMLSGIQSSITSGFGDIQTALCGGFAGVNASVNNAQNALAQQMYANQIADLERSYNAQTASTQGMNALQSQLAQCCCDQKASVADVKYTIANEACATRANATANTQTILDKLCQLEMDGYKRENDNLRQQLNMATLAASQNAQTAQIEAGQRALANEVEQYVAPNPKPAYIVSSPYCCNQNYQCGCGM
jgi:hypothetical protein